MNSKKMGKDDKEERGERRRGVTERWERITKRKERVKRRKERSINEGEWIRK